MPAEIRRQRMTIDEYHLLPFHPGWKVEYMRGEAVFWPRESCAYGIVPVRAHPRLRLDGVALRTPDTTDSAALIELFRAAFSDSPEYAGWPQDTFDAESEKVVAAFFARNLDAVSGAARVAVVDAAGPEDGALAGAMFVTGRGIDAAMLDVLVVAPAWQHRGVGSALAAAALDQLAASGCQRLISRWHLANEPSIAWHRKLGFVEEPDLFNAQLYLRAAEQEMRRLEKLGDITEPRHADLLRAQQHWKGEIARLEALLDHGDKAGAFACHRFAR